MRDRNDVETAEHGYQSGQEDQGPNGAHGPPRSRVSRRLDDFQVRG
jgi:hypothetical protein